MSVKKISSSVAMLLAGGQGSRLSILSQRRAKPAVPFGGIYRIIDFTISNAMNSNIPYLGVLTQYKPYSLMDHIGNGSAWGYVGRKRVAKILPPYTGEDDSDWYLGTADAVYQNISFINRFNSEVVVILSGDHVYKMDYSAMIDFHLEHNADLTIAMQEVPWEDVSRFGVARTDSDSRIIAFQEKPKINPISNKASLGIYAFNAKKLIERLVEDAENPNSSHDFGKDVIPGMIKRDKVFCYLFDGYWRDVGTIKSYWDANMESLKPDSGLSLDSWNVRTNAKLDNLKCMSPCYIGDSTDIRNSLISRGCEINGTVINSIISPGVEIQKGAHVEGCIILDECIIKEGVHIKESILDKNCIIGAGCNIGSGDNIENLKFPHLLDSGITVIGKSAVLPDGIEVGKNCLIFPEVKPENFSEKIIKSGTTIFT